jgi:gluconolactonase
MSDAGKFEEVATGLQFPEGPVALPDGSTLVVEIKRGTLTKVGTDGKAAVVADLGGGPNGAAIGPDGACYVANNGGFNWSQLAGMDIPFDLETMSSEPPGFAGGWIDRVDLATGDHTVLYKDWEGQRFCGPNDIVFDDAGGFWFTDFGKTRAHDMDKGALYYAKTDGSSIVQASRGLYGPNGVGLSPKGDRVYVGETFTGRLLAWDLDGPGHVKMPMATVVDATKGHFDSLAVEESGAVVVAAIGGGLCVVQPDGSGHEYLPIDDQFVTNVCFTGDDMRNAFVTLSGTGRLVAMDWARPGLPLAH